MMTEMRGKGLAEAVDEEEEEADGPVVAVTIVMRVMSVEAGFGTTRRVIPNQMSWFTLRDGEHGSGGPREPRL